ncbi:CheY-like superfamily [Hyaloraphidium curvatum]|nr:CheY-like superfamily [Hyaloraphidium curvatum]
MDIQMPILDGLEATRRIRHEIPAHDQPSIIALTANAMLDDRANCIAAGMDSHLAKPVKARDLYAAVGGMGGERRKRLLNGAREPARAPTV